MSVRVWGVGCKVWDISDVWFEKVTSPSKHAETPYSTLNPALHLKAQTLNPVQTRRKGVRNNSCSKEHPASEYQKEDSTREESVFGNVKNEVARRTALGLGFGVDPSRWNNRSQTLNHAQSWQDTFWRVVP